MTADETLELPGFQYKHGDRPLDGFTIQRAAGRGGFGEVYYALSDSGREVALKLVHTYEQIELRGISQCMNLKNPQLVTIFDVKYGNDRRPWVIMEFVAGPSLRELLDAAPSGLGPAKTAFFLREIGKGLSYLHDCGIVHRDLKPGNIFYENGYVKIGDYGLSKTMSMTRHSGQTVAVGTLHYMAPEIGEGRYDRSIDIYALGALTFEMITGQVPFFGSSPAEVLMKHLTSDVSLDGVPEPFKSVIRKAMAKNPADRYQSVQEMVEAVFGSEEIRNSVSQFSPGSLTMVAGRAAWGIGSGPPASSNPPPPANLWQTKADRLNDRLTRLGEKIKGIGDRFNPHFAIGNRAQVGPPQPDTMHPQTRYLLASLAVVLAGFFTVINVSQKRVGAYSSFVVLSIIGAAAGAMFARRAIAPGVRNESPWVKRLALGAPIAGGAMILSLFSWMGNQDASAHLENVLTATFCSLLLLQWDERVSPRRKDRFSIGHLLTSALAGLIAASIFGAGQAPVIAAVAGASLAVSLISEWTPRSSMDWAGAGAAPTAPNPAGGAAPTPAIDASREDPMGAPPIPSTPIWRKSGRAPGWNNPLGKEAQFLAPLMVVGIFLMIFSHSGKPFAYFIPVIIVFMVLKAVRGGRRGGADMNAGNYIPGGSSFSVREAASSVTRGVLSVISGILLVISLLAALGVVMDVPGLGEIGALDPNLPHRLEQALGTTDWPRMARELGVVIAVVGGFAAMIFMLPARRIGGAKHMLRGVLGTIVLFSAVIAMGRALPQTGDVVIGANRAATMDWYFQHIQVGRAIWAGSVYILGMFLLAWPPRRERPALAVESAPKSAGTAEPDVKK